MAERAIACELAGPGFDVAAHVLAHVPVGGAASPVVRAASLHDPRYRAWCTRALDRQAVEPTIGDAALVGALLERAPAGHLLQAVLGLFDDAESHHRSAALELDDLGGRGAPWALSALRALAADAPELVAITRCAVGLVSAAYAAAWRGPIRLELEDARVLVEEQLATVASVVPSLTTARIALSHPLGSRGRVLPGLLVIGAPVAWVELDAAGAAAIAVHEHAVAIASARTDATPTDPESPARGAPARSAGHSPPAQTSAALSPGPAQTSAAHAPGPAARRWAEVEALALAAVPRLSLPRAVAEAHHRHVATLDTSALPPVDRGAVEELVRRLAR